MSGAHSMFVPSDELTGLYVQGAKERLAELQALPPAELGEKAPLEFNLDASHVAQVISDRIADVLVSLGGRRQAGVLNYDVIANEEFVPEVRNELLELFPFDREQGAHFCSKLVGELRGFLKQGGVIGGRWGQVALRRGQIALDVKPLPEKARQLRNREMIKAFDL